MNHIMFFYAFFFFFNYLFSFSTLAWRSAESEDFSSSRRILVCSAKGCSEKFHKTLRKTPVPESLF